MPRLQALPPSQIVVPVIVLYELQYGILRMPPELAAPRLTALNQLLQPWQMLPFDAACAEQAAKVRVALEAQGQPIGPHDTLIAATALRYQATLITRNSREFSRVVGLQWQNWHQEDWR